MLENGNPPERMKTEIGLLLRCARCKRKNPIGDAFLFKHDECGTSIGASDYGMNRYVGHGSSRVWLETIGSRWRHESRPEAIPGSAPSRRHAPPPPCMRREIHRGGSLNASLRWSGRACNRQPCRAIQGQENRIRGDASTRCGAERRPAKIRPWRGGVLPGTRNRGSSAADAQVRL